MNGKTISLTIVGFLIGMLAAGGIGVRVIEEVRTDEDATSLPPENISTTTLPVPIYFVDPDETLIGSTAVVPKSVVRSGTGLEIAYNLISMAPADGVPPIEFFSFRQRTLIPHDELPFIYPRTWIARTETESFEGSAANPDARIARFELPDGLDTSSIDSVEIIDPLMAFPLDDVFLLSQDEPAATVVEGVTAKLLDTSVQGDTTIVQIELVADDVIDLGFSVEGVGSGWRSARFVVDGHSRVNLTWVGGELPDVMTFRAHGIRWVPLTGSFPVSIGRFQ